MITNTKILKKYCINYTKIENYDTAIKSPLRYDLHHRREISENKSKSDLIEENLYFHRPPEELIFLEHGEHIRLHNANRSEETRQKISDANKGNQCALGHHCSTETRQKISDANKGKQKALGHHWNLSAETKQRMSAAHKGDKNPMFGKPKSAETKRKMSEALKGDKNPMFGKHPSAESRQKISEAHKGLHWHLENGHRIWTD